MHRLLMLKKVLHLVALIYLASLLSCASSTDRYGPYPEDGQIIHVYKFKCTQCHSIKTEIPEEERRNQPTQPDLVTPAYATCDHLWEKVDEMIYVRRFW